MCGTHVSSAELGQHRQTDGHTDGKEVITKCQAAYEDDKKKGCSLSI